MNHSAKKTALGGVLAALAIVIMCMGGLIPVATFVCPILCMVLLWIVMRFCGSRIAWAWYGAVAILCVLLGPDKEAAAVFLFLGYYPILKPRIDRMKPHLAWKLLLFNGAIAIMYVVLIWLFGMEQIAAEYQELGWVMLIVMLLLGNVTFFLLDKLLDRVAIRKSR